jgi:large-conductance mechanosensitive channel
MNTESTFEISWGALIAQAVNLIFVILIISLPFILWNWFQRNRKNNDEKLNRMQEEIDELKANKS